LGIWACGVWSLKFEVLKSASIRDDMTQQLPTLIALVALAAVSTAAQTPRVATTADMLLASAVFFHGRTVVLQQKLIVEGDLARLANAPKPMYALWKDRAGGDGAEGEVRGEFWDLGRLEAGDGRFAGYDFTRLLESANRGRWPARDQIFVILGATFTPASVPRTPTVRAIALAPGRFAEQTVKVIGRFKGRNLYGDLPQALAKGKWDFVIQSAEGALWVTGVRPRGKDFDLDPGKRVDTGRWVEVTGAVKQEGATTYIAATAIALAAAPEDSPVEVMLPDAPPAPAPEIIFSAPVADDSDVDRSAPVRIQFSVDMDPKSIRDRVRITYLGREGGPAPPPPPVFAASYVDPTHAVEIKFAQPLEPFQQVRVELLEGISALDKQLLRPWALTFRTGR